MMIMWEIACNKAQHARLKMFINIEWPEGSFSQLMHLIICSFYIFYYTSDMLHMYGSMAICMHVCVESCAAAAIISSEKLMSFDWFSMRLIVQQFFFSFRMEKIRKMMMMMLFPLNHLCFSYFCKLPHRVFNVHLTIFLSVCQLENPLCGDGRKITLAIFCFVLAHGNCTIQNTYSGIIGREMLRRRISTMKSAALWLELFLTVA